MSSVTGGETSRRRLQLSSLPRVWLEMRLVMVCWVPFHSKVTPVSEPTERSEKVV